MKISKEALPQAEKMLETIKYLAGEREIVSIPLKTLAEAAGFNENQKTSARETLTALERVGAIKVEWIFDPEAASQGELVYNPEMPDARIVELLALKVIKDVAEDRYSARNPVITVLKPSLSDC